MPRESLLEQSASGPGEPLSWLVPLIREAFWERESWKDFGMGQLPCVRVGHRLLPIVVHDMSLVHHASIVRRSEYHGTSYLPTPTGSIYLYKVHYFIGI